LNLCNNWIELVIFCSLHNRFVLWDCLGFQTFFYHFFFNERILRSVARTAAYRPLIPACCKILRTVDIESSLFPWIGTVNLRPSPFSHFLWEPRPFTASTGRHLWAMRMGTNFDSRIALTGIRSCCMVVGFITDAYMDLYLQTKFMSD